MGTRRSRHNKGVKPLYKEHRRGLVVVRKHLPIVDIESFDEPPLEPRELLAGQVRMWGDYIYRPWSEERRFRASENAKARLAGLPQIFPHVDPKVEIAANRKAMDALFLAPEGIWRPRPKPMKVKLTKPRREAGAALLVYPYIAKPRQEHADIVAVNNLIPKSIPENMRADMCQEIMLALLEGRVTMNDLRARKDNGRYFIRKFYHDNFEQDGRAVSLSGYDEDDSRSYDEIAGSIAAREWRDLEMNDARKAYDALRTFSPPTQLNDVWESQVRREQSRRHTAGDFVSFEEAAELLGNW